MSFCPALFATQLKKKRETDESEKFDIFRLIFKFHFSISFYLSHAEFNKKKENSIWNIFTLLCSQLEHLKKEKEKITNLKGSTCPEFNFRISLFQFHAPFNFSSRFVPRCSLDLVTSVTRSSARSAYTRERVIKVTISIPRCDHAKCYLSRYNVSTMIIKNCQRIDRVRRSMVIWRGTEIQLYTWFYNGPNSPPLWSKMLAWSRSETLRIFSAIACTYARSKKYSAFVNSVGN